MALTSKERQERFLRQHRKLGRIPKRVYTHPEDWPDVKRYVERKNRKRERGHRK